MKVKKSCKFNFGFHTIPYLIGLVQNCYNIICCCDNEIPIFVLNSLCEVDSLFHFQQYIILCTKSYYCTESHFHPISHLNHSNIGTIPQSLYSAFHKSS